MRRILGITGPPGVGKSTYAAALVEACALPAALVPMDGFHLHPDELVARGLRDRMGTPETFDAAGYAQLLGELRGAAGPVLAPGFDRVVEAPVPGAITIPADVRLVVTEGNYLLLDRPGWCEARAALDEVWYLELPDDIRRERLRARHLRYGKTPAEADRWMARVDEPDARLVAATRERADKVIALPVG